MLSPGKRRAGGLAGAAALCGALLGSIDVRSDGGLVHKDVLRELAALKQRG